MIDKYDLEQLDNNLSFIERTIGKEWLEDWVHRMRDNMGRIQYQVPPLAMLWLRAKDELALDQLTGSVNPSEATLRLARLGSNLEYLSAVPGYKEQLPLLIQGQDAFVDIDYRLDVATAFARQNIKISLACKPEEPDIILTLSTGKVPVFTASPPINKHQDMQTIVIKALNESLKGLKPPGMIYIDMPQIAIYTPEQLLNKTTDFIRNNVELPKGIKVVISTLFIENARKCPHLMRSYHPVV